MNDKWKLILLFEFFIPSGEYGRAALYGKARGRIIERRRRKHQSRVTITGEPKRKWREASSLERAAPLNVITLTDCWQVGHYPGCTEGEADRTGEWQAGGHWGGQDTRSQTKLGRDCCLRLRRFLCCEHFNCVVWDWGAGPADPGNEGAHNEMFNISVEVLSRLDKSYFISLKPDGNTLNTLTS